MNKTILAVASGGGHWKQLMVIKSAFKYDTHFITTINGLPEQNNIKNYYIINDCNKSEPLLTIKAAIQLFKIIKLIKPHVIVSTGAAPGILAIMIGRLFNCKTIWVDSIANSEQMSMGGKIARKVATKVLTQWPQLADNKVEYLGGIY